MVRRLVVILGTLVPALLLAGPAVAGPNLFVGTSDSILKYEPTEAAGVARDLGMKAFRVLVQWTPGRTDLTPSDVAELDRAVAPGLRVVVAIHGESGDQAPKDATAREEYCTFARNMLARYPAINDVVVWIEPNKSTFWKPQFNPGGLSAAPAAYEALLARCWDVLHAFRPGVNVIAASTSPRGNDRPNAVSNISHSPGNFIRKMGEAYRASGRTERIFDTVGHHAYGEHSAEPPDYEHKGSTTISQGDWQRLMQALYDAYHGTGQPIPGECDADWCVYIWYLEMGYQTIPDPEKQSLYTGVENDPHPLADLGTAPDQRSQFTDGVRLAFCQPYVQGFFNFQLWDEADLGRWQSAPLWADRARKASYSAFQEAIAAVNAGAVDCPSLGAEVPNEFVPKIDVAVERTEWPPARSFNFRNTLWRFRIETGEDAGYVAMVVRVARRPRGLHAPAARRGRPVLTTRGRLKQGYFSFVKFPSRRLTPGYYQFVVTLTSMESAARKKTLTSKPFIVLAKRGQAAGR